MEYNIVKVETKDEERVVIEEDSVTVYTTDLSEEVFSVLEEEFGSTGP